ncbi:hypothetical protein N0A02_33470 (plasmid) [Paraburkholderia acidicola]|uniref:Uncharacterized protein n=1 Tax=Paraburkholderia acidicola TaxID=1912599 RepID=A0ABV1LYF6_9BURK
MQTLLAVLACIARYRAYSGAYLNPCNAPRDFVVASGRMSCLPSIWHRHQMLVHPEKSAHRQNRIDAAVIRRADEVVHFADPVFVAVSDGCALSLEARYPAER